MPNEQYITTDFDDTMQVSKSELPYFELPRRHTRRANGSHLNVQTRDIAIAAMMSLTAISGRDRGETMDEKFTRLADRWEHDTQFLSSLGDIVTQKDHLQIMAMGIDVVPLILKRMRRQPGLWFEALRFLTRDDPVTDDIRGDMDAMTKAWLEWGERNGYC